MKKIKECTISRTKNKSLIDYANIYANVEKATLEQISAFELPLAKLDQRQDDKKLERLRDRGALVRNNSKSIVSNNRISSACEACRTGVGSYTTFVSLKCHRDCYFCFNKNQENYTFYLQNKKNANGELAGLVKQGVQLTHLALTGGEPLLHPEETVAFFQLAHELVTDAHTRLYTAGDFISEELLKRLQATHLSEIRFSIKMEDSHQKRKHILSKIALAKKFIPDVLVEMPVIPGTTESMKELLLELEELEIFGINLLEFCFPLEDAKSFQDNGLELKNPPYDIYYNYWYAGGLAINQSEKICLELVDFAMEKELKLGVHYCSLENKFTGQIYQQNFDQDLGELYILSERDFLFKTAKVFGKEQKKVISILSQHQMAFELNKMYDYIQFPIEGIKLLGTNNINIVISSNIVEMEQNERLIHEVNIEWTTPLLFEESAL
ncbi:MAG: radical SAM protein [Bacillus sp. (in: Bacteria)]|nr:radical SAM protein [Bacillus sp. (in: firmicutes)]